MAKLLCVAYFLAAVVAIQSAPYAKAQTSSSDPCVGYKTSGECDRNPTQCIWQQSPTGASSCVPKSTTGQPGFYTTGVPSQTQMYGPCPYTSAETCGRNKAECVWNESTSTCVPLYTTPASYPPYPPGTSPSNNWNPTTSNKPTGNPTTTRRPETSPNWNPTNPPRTSEPNWNPTNPPRTSEPNWNPTNPPRTSEPNWNPTNPPRSTTQSYWPTSRPETKPAGMSTTRAQQPPTSSPPRCQPTSLPVVSLEKVNGTLYTTRWIRMFANVAPYWACDIDHSPLVSVSWTITVGGRSIQLPPGAVANGRGLALPPFSVPAGSGYIIATAVYSRNIELMSQTYISVQFSPLMNPTVTLLGGSVTVGASQEFGLFGDIRMACTSAKDCVSDSGLIPYVCTSNNGGCKDTIYWSCSVTGASGNCSSLLPLFAQRRTMYTGLRLPVGEYTITLFARGDSLATWISSKQRISVVDTPKPQVSLNCVGRFTTERLACTVVAARDLKVTWTVNGVQQIGVSGPYMTIPITADTRTIIATVTDSKGNNNTATYTLTPVLASLSCTRNVDTAVGLQTSISVSCAVVSSIYTTQLTYAYRAAGVANETALSPIAQPAGVAFVFTAPPIKASVVLVVRALVDGKVIAEQTLPQISVAYEVNAADITTLTDAVTDSKTIYDVTGTLTAVNTLSTVSQAATKTQRNQIAATVIDAVSTIVNYTATNSSSPSSQAFATTARTALSDSETVMATTAVANAVVQSGVSADADMKAKAAAALAQLSSVAAQKGTDETRDALLKAVETLGDNTDTKEIAKQVAVAVMLAAPADGTVNVAGSGNVRVSAAKFVATDAVNRSVAVDGSSVTMPSSFSIAGADETKTAGLVARSSKSADSANPAPTGRQFLSDITSFEAYFGDQKYEVRNQEPIAIRLAASTSSSGTIVYLNETTGKWISEGVRTTGRCPDSSAHICGTTTHFTSFAVVSGSSSDDSSSSSSLAVIVGVVIGAIVLIAVVALVVVKMRKSDELTEKDIEMSGAIPLTELSSSSHRHLTEV